MAEMKKQQEKKAEWIQRGHGEYNEVPVEKDFFKEIKKEERALCHFFRSNNRACDVLDQHLQVLAKKHIETKFFKVNAEKAPYLVEKLNVAILPSLALIRNEKVVAWVVGLDELGGSYDFKTEWLAARLAQDQIIHWQQGDGYDRRPAEHRNNNIRRGGFENIDNEMGGSDEDSDFD